MSNNTNETPHANDRPAEPVSAPFTVYLTVDPQAYADEYGVDPSVEAAVQYAHEMLKARMTEAWHMDGKTMPSFADSHGHWAQVTVGSPLIHVQR